MMNFQYYKRRLRERIDLFKLKKHGLVSGDVEFFFIISAGRSGSTLLRKQLMENAKIGIPPESEDFIPKLVKLFLSTHKKYDVFVEEVLQLIEQMDCLKAWNLNINEIRNLLLSLSKENRKIDVIIHLIYSKALIGYSGDTLIGDKTPLLNDYLRLLSVVFPKGKLIYMIRDGRAVVNSYVGSRNYTLKRAILRWQSSISNFEKFQDLFAKRLLILKYEELVLETKDKLGAILVFLNKSKHVTNIRFEDLGDSGLSHHSNVRNPVNTSSLNRWKEELSSKEIQEINESLRLPLEKYNYI